MTRTTPSPRYDIAALFPELAPLARQTIRLHPRPGPEPPVNASKLGGHILWPADEPWPVCTEPEWNPWDENAPPHDHIYVPILQLRRDDFPDFPFPDGTGLFQFLWCPSYHEINLGPICKAYWRTEAAIANPLTSIPTPTLFEEGWVPRPCVLHPERITEYPLYSELPVELNQQIRQWEEEYRKFDVYERELSIVPGTKLGGYPSWVQFESGATCECGRDMEYLLTIASWEFSGGTWMRWCPADEVQATGLSIAELDAWPTWRHALSESLQGAGISLGDVGSLYLFVCRHCPGWPVAGVMQSH